MFYLVSVTYMKREYIGYGHTKAQAPKERRWQFTDVRKNKLEPKVRMWVPDSIPDFGRDTSAFVKQTTNLENIFGKVAEKYMAKTSVILERGSRSDEMFRGTFEQARECLYIAMHIMKPVGPCFLFRKKYTNGSHSNGSNHSYQTVLPDPLPKLHVATPDAESAVAKVTPAVATPQEKRGWTPSQDV